MPRELIDTSQDKRYVRRDRAGRFDEVDDVGRSLAGDVRRKAKTTVRSGEGDRGDRRAAAKTTRRKAAAGTARRGGGSVGAGKTKSVKRATQKGRAASRKTAARSKRRRARRIDVRVTSKARLA
jgi:hypothetical protein